MERQISEVEPVQARKICGPALLKLRLFVEHIVDQGDTLGLIGPRELKRIWTRHVLNCALVGVKVAGGNLIDVGSGAGFPGLIIAASRPDVFCTLVEPMSRRAHWLEAESARLGLSNVVVLNKRAEDLHGDISADTVTARAVAPLRKLLPICAPLSTPSGELIFMKGKRLTEEMKLAESEIRKWNLINPRVEITGPEYQTEETYLFRAKVG